MELFIFVACLLILTGIPYMCALFEKSVPTHLRVGDPGWLDYEIYKDGKTFTSAYEVNTIEGWAMCWGYGNKLEKVYGNFEIRRENEGFLWRVWRWLR